MSTRRARRRGFGALALTLSLMALLAARPSRAWALPFEIQRAPSLPPAARAVDIDEHLGASVRRSLAFTDMTGRAVTLGEVLPAAKPTIVVLAYYRCPMLCGLVLRGLVTGLREVRLGMGRDYGVVTVSFDPRDTPEAARRKRASTLVPFGVADADPSVWPFLVGAEANDRALADDLGIRYAYDARTDQYAHPAVAIVLTPEGRISRYLYGVDFTPRDLRLALVEAGEGKVGNIVDRVLLTCYRYDPSAHRYGPFVVGFMRLGGALILAAVTLLLVVLFWRGRRANAAASRLDSTGGAR